MGRDYGTILVTGGAGFVGSNLAIRLASVFPSGRVVAADNLRRRGSELTLPRLRAHGIEYVHADVRNAEDLALPGLEVELLLDCSAEPSVLAAHAGDVDYVVQTNLLGTVNCLQVAARTGADLVFLSTSRVYPVAMLNEVRVEEDETRFRLAERQTLPGVSAQGVAEDFPLTGVRSLYGATKLASELLIHELADLYGLRYVIDRCGVITGPWQMAKLDQGVFALWVAHHHFSRPLSYIGWEATGKQVRDLLHVDDLADLLLLQLARLSDLAGNTYNVGGGVEGSLSLLETTALCRELTGATVPIGQVAENRPGDVRVYVTDNRRVSQATGWKPARTPRQTLGDILGWLREHGDAVEHLWQ